MPRRPYHLTLLTLLLALANHAQGAKPPLAIAAQSITSAELADHVATLADDVFEGRAVGTRGGRAAANYIVQQLLAAHAQPAGSDATYFQACDRGGRNILAILPGSDPILRHEIILVGAHYDHVGDGSLGHANGPIGKIFNGADDNASGCAALLEIIEALTAIPDLGTRRTIVIAFWDGEEMGMVGSKHWLAAPTVSPAAIKLAVNIDMIGRLRDGRLEIGGTRTGYGLRRFLSRAHDNNLWLDFSWELKANSDHWPFVERQIPVVMLHTGLHDDYHRPSDDAEKINRAGLASITRYLLDIIVASANAESLPAYRSAHQFESLAAQRARDQRDDATASGAWPSVQPPRFGISWRTDEAEPSSIYLTHVAPGSPAAQAQLAAGDRIYQLNGKPFATGDDFRDQIAGLVHTATRLTLLVETRGHVRQVEVTLHPATFATTTDTPPST